MLRDVERSAGAADLPGRLRSRRKQEGCGGVSPAKRIGQRPKKRGENQAKSSKKTRPGNLPRRQRGIRSQDLGFRETDQAKGRAHSKRAESPTKKKRQDGSLRCGGFTQCAGARGSVLDCGTQTNPAASRRENGMSLPMRGTSGSVRRIPANPARPGREQR
jgi:hypothetical protein